jgi:molybdopterin/thiamine biosynthesis adenylyltransferase
MSMSGVGNFILIDPDILESHNVVRHAGDAHYIDQPKVEVVKQLILGRNPEANVTTYQMLFHECQNAFDKADLVVVAGLGSEVATANLAAILRKKQKLVLYGGLYEKGVAGEIFAVRPNKGPCYACFASILRETQPELGLTEVNYGLPVDELKAQPGLVTGIMRVSSALADWALRLLIRDKNIVKGTPGNLVILANEPYNMNADTSGKIPVLQNHGSMWFNIRTNQECLVCSLKEELVMIEDLLGDIS